ncbi:unnamed protein product, partial [Mesorhabditis spiculigera]
MIQLPPNCHPIQYGCHVTNISAHEACPSFHQVQWRPAADNRYDGVLCGYPMAFFTTSLAFKWPYNELAKDIIELVWKYSEWLVGSDQFVESSAFYRERFTPKMIQIVHCKATHGTPAIACNCCCEHWDVVGKIHGDFRDVFDEDAIITTILDRFESATHHYF